MQLPLLCSCQPAMQKQAALPVGELEAKGHSKHVDTDTAPVAVEYLPASQPLQPVHQKAVPAALLNVPATHCCYMLRTNMLICIIR